MRDRRGPCRVFVGNPEGKRPLGRPSRRWGVNFKVDLQEIGWTDLVQDGGPVVRSVYAVTNIRVLEKAANLTS
jgi:hypothetical protein